MCGILGLFGDDLNVQSNDKRSFIVEGLIVDQLRGSDGTGLAFIPRHKKDPTTVFKKAMKGSDFVELKGCNKLVNRMHESIGYIGHNRSWTRGNPVDENCHPFQFKHISLVHNGTVTNATTLVSGKDYKQMDVDSAHVSYAISLESAKDVLPRLDGGYSLVWWDHDERSLNFARNDARPMYFAFGSGKDQTMYYGSEAEMIVLLARRNGLKLQSEFLATTPYVHYVFKDPKDVRTFERRPFEKRPYGYVSHPQSDYSNGYGTMKNGKWTSAQTSIHTKPTVPLGGTPISTATPNNTEGPQRDTAVDGSTPVGLAEIVTPSAAAAMSEPIEKGSKRYERFEELCDDNRIGLGRGVVAKVVKWFPYNIGKGLSSNIGVMVCEVTRTELNKINVVHVFGVHTTRWTSLSKSPSRHVVLDMIGYRENEKWQTPLIFVGKINEGLQQKYTSAGPTGESDANKPAANADEPQSDPGTKPDWIEIGTKSKRLVSPQVLDSLLASGCHCCTEHLDHSMLDVITWIGHQDDKPMCLSCGTDPQIVDAMQYIM